MPKQDPAPFSTASSTAFNTAVSPAFSTASIGAAERGAAQDTGPAPATRRPPLRELPRTDRNGTRHRFQAPRRTY
ncbi:hypothetical protein ACFY8C_15045 [Streptomyces flavochromogenes]|uniref:Uncharacterized protein n=1 Tax=Streptomyces flavochromogenes TaxID=68199 RepID=A0ABW6XQG3_9ACTN|nr:hypothetical protein [Streptomyces flavochromogenes]